MSRAFYASLSYYPVLVYDLFDKFTASFRLSTSGPAEIARDRSRYKLQRAASLFADEAAENTP